MCMRKMAARVSISSRSRPSIKPAEAAAIQVKSSPRKQSSQRGSQLAPSFVRKDGIMKEVVQLEEKAKNTWDTRFGFLKNTMQLFELELQQHGISTKIAQKSFRRKKYEKLLEISNESSMHLSPQLPKTSSGMVGWLAEGACRLDVAGPLYVSPKMSAFAPNSYELFLKKQQHIILG